ncbi:MAG: cytochrome c oxidase assembly protein [Bacteriovoracaceae bacterium]|nr:cytochrome c oxidase assembly protein [Bacteriovoracaceae bacterium]
MVFYAMAIFLTVLFISFNLFAHGGAHQTSIDYFQINSELHIWAGLGAMIFLYFKGVKQTQSRRNIKTRPKHQTTFFCFGMFCLFLALISSIDFYSEALASIHMLQHTLILMVAAPLLALSGMDYYFMNALSPVVKSSKINMAFRRFIKITRFSRPLWIWIIYAATLWIWHIPMIYESALEGPLVHDFQHIGFFASSYLFWRVSLSPYGFKISPPSAVIYLFVSMLHAMVLGALMGLSQSVWYSPYIRSSMALEIDPVADQQIAGLIMWMPAGTSFIIVAVFSIYKLLNYSSIESK